MTVRTRPPANPLDAFARGEVRELRPRGSGWTEVLDASPFVSGTASGSNWRSGSLSVVQARATALDLGCRLRVTVREVGQPESDGDAILDLTLVRPRGGAYQWVPTLGAGADLVEAWAAALEKRP